MDTTNPYGPNEADTDVLRLEVIDARASLSRVYLLGRAMRMSPTWRGLMREAETRLESASHACRHDAMLGRADQLAAVVADSSGHPTHRMDETIRLREAADGRAA